MKKFVALLLMLLLTLSILGCGNQPAAEEPINETSKQPEGENDSYISNCITGLMYGLMGF